MFAGEVTVPASPKIADPENCGETNSKIAFESCRRFRQVSPSELEIEVRACLFATVEKRPKLGRGTRGRNRYEVAKGG